MVGPKSVSVHGPYGDPRAQAARADLGERIAQAVPESRHGPEQMQNVIPPAQRAKLADRFETWMPKLASGGARTQVESFVEGLLPPGAGLVPGAGAGYAEARHRRTAGGVGGGFGGGGGHFTSPQRPYAPEFDSPDRQNFPVHRNLANIYWRLFFKLDPVVGNGIDLISQLPWGNFELSGEGVDGEVKDAYERMCEVSRFRSVLPFILQEFMVLGEACIHNYFDNNEGIWTYIALHNPDQLEVIHTPTIKMEPIVRFKPDSRLQAVLSVQDEAAQLLRESMPPSLLNALTSGQHITLSPLNFTFLARKMHPYDVRGTSILTRMWRVFMYEDGVFNASIATARRHAGPVKVAKLGDQATGWIPSPEQEAAFVNLVAQAELDPLAWVVWNYGVNFEMVGTTDRMMNIAQHWDVIERIKLIALGISRAFLHGEVTYASAASGLAVFLQRLKALREMVENLWIYPKFFRPVAEMNAWVKPTEAELSHRVRTRRAKWQGVADRYIVPRVEWERVLDPSIDQAQLNAVQALQQMGITFSKSYLAGMSGRDWEEELRQRGQEATLEQEIMAQNPALAVELQAAAMAAAGGGMGGPPMLGGGLPPEIPPDMMGFPGGSDAELPPIMDGGPPEAASPGMHAAPGESGAPSGGSGRLKSHLWDDDRYGGWTKEDVAPLVALLHGQTSEAEESMWSGWLKSEPEAEDYLASRNSEAVWHSLEGWLLDRGDPVSNVSALKAILETEGVLKAPRIAKSLFDLEKMLDTSSVSLYTGAS
jgi:hypothetical protein